MQMVGDSAARWRRSVPHIQPLLPSFPESGNIVTGAFALVLALKLVPAIKPHYLTDIPSVDHPLGSPNKSARRQIAMRRLCA